jgi:hypothetical protein
MTSSRDGSRYVSAPLSSVREQPWVVFDAADEVLQSGRPRGEDDVQLVAFAEWTVPVEAAATWTWFAASAPYVAFCRVSSGIGHDPTHPRTPTD